MIEYVKGDVIKPALAGEFKFLVHQCNCFNNMGAGIAPLIAKAFPDAEAVDLATVKGAESKLGTFTISTANPECSVVNLYGQYGTWKRRDGKPNTDLVAVRSGLTKLDFYLKANGIQSAKIGMPKIGAGLGGETWDNVSAVIEETLSDHLVFVYFL